MAILVVAIENHKNREIDLLCTDYLKKITGPFATKLELLPAARVNDPDQQKLKETESVLKLVKPGDVVFLCDERGSSPDSLQFESLISKELATLRGRLIFAIGGAYGFTAEALKNHTCIRLSHLTFPHHLARLVLIEQIYRAYNISKGTGYHHI